MRPGPIDGIVRSAWLWAWLALVPSTARVETFVVSGSVKTFARYESTEIPFIGFTTATGEMSLRLKVTGSPHLPVEAAYVLVPRARSQSTRYWTRLFVAPDPPSYRLDDLRPTWGGNADDHRALGQNLDRLNLRLQAGGINVRLGRQPVAFGVGRLTSPMDVLAPFPNQTLDTEERIGMDAVRIRTGMGDLSEMDLGAVGAPGNLPENGVLFIKPRFRLGSNDVNIMTMRFRRNFLAGFSLQRSIGGAGFWMEQARVDPDGGGEPYDRFLVGLDQQWTDRSYVWGEYHFNGAGRKRFLDCLESLESTAYTEGGVYLLGRDYGSVGMTHQWHPLVKGTVLVTVNLSDGSWQTAPSLEVSVSQDIYLDLGAFLTFGEPMDVDATGLRGGSEFQAYPDAVYTSVRCYF